MSDWNSLPLGALVSFQKGKKVDTSPYLLPGYRRYLGASSLDGSKIVYASTYLAVQANTNDVLMLWDGERSGLVGHGLEGVVSSTVSKLSPKNEIESSYLYYFLLNNFEWIQNNRTGTGIPHVPKDLGRILSVYYPVEKNYQQKVSLIIGTLDLTIQKTEELIEKYQQIKTGLMQDLFTRGIGVDGKLRPIRENAPELYHETKVGWIPKDWEVVTCQDVCEKIIDCKNRTPPITADGYPVIRTPNVRHGEFKDKQLVFTDLHSYHIWTARGKPKVGDVVITREAPVGEVCKIPERHDQACLGQRMMLYRTDSTKINNDFFLYALQSESIQLRLDLISGGSTVGHVRVGDIRDLWMYQPASEAEQIYIGNSLNTISTKLEAEKVNLSKLTMQKKGIMDDFLSGNKLVTVDETEATNV
jgi:type I restriction enzyme S subunit